MLQYYLDLKTESDARAVPPDALQQSLPFQLQHCGRFYTADKYFTKREGMQSYLLLITTEGSGQLQYKNQTDILKPGSAVVIDCSCYHEYNTLPGDIWNFYYLHFTALSMAGFDLLLNRLTRVMLRSPRSACHMMEELYELSLQSGTTAYIRHSNLISCLLTEMVCSLEENQNAMPNRQDIAQLAEHIRRHFKEPLTMEDFMRIARLSRYYLIHTFHQQMGASPYRYLHICRIRHAEMLLTTTDFTVGEIACQVGYASSTVFIRHFKDLNGMTPGDYRNGKKKAYAQFA